MHLEYSLFLDLYGFTHRWSLSPAKGLPSTPSRVKVNFNIIGNIEQGFNLVLEPEGYSPADYNYQNLADAKEHAKQHYRIELQEWNIRS